MPPYLPPSQSVDVTVVYGEAHLQTSFKINNEITVSQLKDRGMTEISQTVAARSGLTIEMDPTNIDFYPDASDQARLRDLEGPLSMVVWPKPSGPNSLTPSPIIGGLKRTTSGLTSEKAAQPLIEESRLSHQGRRQRSIPPATSDVNESTQSLAARMDEIEQRFRAQEQKIQTLKQGTQTLKRESQNRNQEIQTLKRESQNRNQEIQTLKWESQNRNQEIQTLRRESQNRNRGIQTLKRESQNRNQAIDELREALEEIRDAVLGDRIAINKIRQRVLLDCGRKKLATICGHPNWASWKNWCSGNREEMLASTATTLRTSDQISGYRKALADNDKALRLLIFPTRVQSRVDLAAHSSHIVDSVHSIADDGDRNAMVAIYSAVCDSSLVFQPAQDATAEIF